ncbi:MAG TPA: tetratricopeptide repeat protein [Phototrophicaceae bacterium]|jgi:tetratricopeptide (TPR) repeat protein|nr:tetratricopeptide repeat protein [Phototrophicaceae bacterium]
MSNAETLQEQGVKLYQQKEFEEAARTFQQAQEQYAADGKKDMVAEMQTNIGLVHRALGEHQQALDIMTVALRTFQEMEDPFRTAQVLGNMGGVFLELGDKEQAYNCYRQAADVFQELGEKKLYGETLLAMGTLQVKDGKIWQGAATYEAGLEQLDHLSPSQRILKSLIGFRNRFSGGSGV